MWGSSRIIILGLVGGRFVTEETANILILVSWQRLIELEKACEYMYHCRVLAHSFGNLVEYCSKVCTKSDDIWHVE